ELNQRLVYRLLNQVEELKRLNQHFVRRASQLADLHRAVQDITSELGVAEMLERLLRALAQAIGTTSLRVELTDPPGVKLVAPGGGAGEPRRGRPPAGRDPPGLRDPPPAQRARANPPERGRRADPDRGGHARPLPSSGAGGHHAHAEGVDPARGRRRRGAGRL